MIEWNYTLEFRSPVSTFSGLSVVGLVDRMVIRDRHRIPCILGSSVKGRWRFYAERLLQSKPSDGLFRELRIHSEDQPICKTPEEACTICRLFGSSAVPCLVWVSQADLDNSTRSEVRRLLELDTNPVLHPDTEIRPGIVKSRSLGIAKEDHLFLDEVVPPTLFKGKIRINGYITETEEQFLRVAGELVDAIGARKAIGRGSLNGGIRISGGMS